MTTEERFNSMVKSSKEAIEDFNDFADDKAIAWAANALAAANERIRELEQSIAIQVDDSQKWYKRHAAEREVSDKLEKALDQMLDDIGRTNRMPSAVKARAALAEVAALRATREKAD